MASGWFQKNAAAAVKMTMIKNVRGVCQQCGGLIEFRADATGTISTCPHCRQETELVLDVPGGAKSGLGLKALIFGIVALLILGGGLGAALYALKRAEQVKSRRAAANTPELKVAGAAGDPFAQIGFAVSPVQLESGASNGLVFAVGTVKNVTGRQRFGVRVELELTDAAGARVGTARDYHTLLEANGQWRFRALVAEKRTVGARVQSVTEDR